MSSAVHRIRLRGFWTTTPLPDGRTAHRRAFGQPRTLDPDERAWLVCDAVSGPAVVTLNGERVGSVGGAGPFAFDVTDRLLPRNDVVIEADAIGEVALEVRAAVNAG